MKLNAHTRGVLLATSGISVISFDSLLIRLQDLTPATVVLWRGVFGAVAFGFLSLVAYRKEAFSALISINLGVIGVVVFTGLSNTMFVVAITHTTVADTLVILASTPLLTSILGLLLLRERLHLRTWLAGGAAFAGVLGIVGGSFGHSGLVGDLAALVGSVSLAMLLITWRKFPDTKQLSAMCIGGCFTAATALPFLGDFSLNGTQAGFAVLNGLVIVPIGLALMSMSTRFIAAPEVSLVTLLEAVLGPFWVWFILREVPTTQTLLCGFLILLTLVVHSYLDLRAEGVRD
jgi:drug/metabolite transporter (DMT)-like permease